MHKGFESFPYAQKKWKSPVSDEWPEARSD